MRHSFGFSNPAFLALLACVTLILTFTVHVDIAAAAQREYASKPGVIERFVDWLSDDLVNGKGVSISQNGFGQTMASWSDGQNRLKVKIDGEVEFGDDDRTIQRLSRSGSFSIWEKSGGRTTRLEVEADRNGELTYEFEVNGQEIPFDEKAEAWLAEAILDVIRKTGIGAEERANRILDREGIDGLIDEVQFVENDFVIRAFLGAALRRDDLSARDCSEILKEVALSMDSDYEKAELLIELASHQSWSAELSADYVDVTTTMESDYEIRRALSELDIDDDVDKSALDALLQVAARMESDYETAELLMSFAPKCRDSERLSELYVNAVLGIDSDYEARRALLALDWDQNMPSAAILGALKVAARLESDYEAAELLSELARHACQDLNSVHAFMAAATEIDSDYELGRSLGSFAECRSLSDDAVVSLLTAAGSMSSSYEQANVLRKTLRHCEGNASLEDAFLTTVDRVDSDYERDRLYSEFYKQGREARRARRGE